MLTHTQTVSGGKFKPQSYLLKKFPLSKLFQRKNAQREKETEILTGISTPNG